jgi:Transglutaminase-like superfamily
MGDLNVDVELADCAAMYDAVALIVPLGIETEFQSFKSLRLQRGCAATIVAERRTGQLSAICELSDPNVRPKLQQTFADTGKGLTGDAFLPEGTAIAKAATDLASSARELAGRAGGGLEGIAAIVGDVSARFGYGDDPDAARWYDGHDAVPQVACAVGNCVDINTYLVAALRSAGYATAYLTCYFFDDDPNRIASGMHCWVRTEHKGVIQDWDIAHFKKVDRSDVSAALNPVPGTRVALAFGRDHTYVWQGLEIHLPTPSRPMWIKSDGSAIWGMPPRLTLATD